MKKGSSRWKEFFFLIKGIFANPLKNQKLSLVIPSFRSVAEFARSPELSRATAIAVAVILPLLVSSRFDALPFGISMAVGVFLSSPSDVPGSLRRRLLGILASALIAVFTTVVASLAVDNLPLFLPLLLLLVFSYSMISVYGFRASLVSFSGLMAVVLSMVTLTSGMSIWMHAAWMGLGGLWYLLFSLFLHFLNPKRQSEEFLEETFELTAEYLRLRTKLLGTPETERRELEKRLSNLQTDLNKNHETVRELLISRRKTSGRSNNTRKKLLIFMELVDILELGMSNPVNYKRMDSLFPTVDKHLERLKEWTGLMASELENIKEHIKDWNNYRSDSRLKEIREDLRRNSLSRISTNSEKDLVLRGLFHFKEKQYQKIVAIERLLQDLEAVEKVVLRSKDAVKFIPAQEFPLKTLQDNLDLSSPIFRHSLRLSIIVLIGFAIGETLGLQNSYWILLTSIVIMRPGYSLTKSRSKERTLGTLIGGAIATGIIFLVHDSVVYGVLAFLSLIAAFSTFQKNYKISAAFITLNIVFVYGLIAPNAFEVIEFRVLDTLIGAGLASMGNAFLWPTWEYKSMDLTIAQSLKAIRRYLEEVRLFYEDKATVPVAYKYSRKEAFLAMGDLNAAFQRMAQEPPSKQKNLKEIYEMVGLVQEMLYSSASLGSFIRSHDITKASVHFSNLVDAIQAHMSNAVNLLEELQPKEKTDEEKVEAAQAYFQNMLKELMENDQQEVLEGEEDSLLPQRIQEAQLVMDQLVWLLEISQSLEVLVRKVWPNPAPLTTGKELSVKGN